MKNNFRKNIFLIILLLLILSGTIGFYSYEDNKKNAEIEFRTLEKLDDKVYFPFLKLIPHFIVYKAFVDHKPLKFIRLGLDASSHYFVPYYALEKSEAVIGYGIWQDIEFENTFSEKYNKPSYAFDCGISKSPKKNMSPLCHFEPECLGTDKCVLPWQTSTKKVHTFPEKLKQLNLEKKPIYVRFDTGAESIPHILDDVLANSDYITGMNIVVHCDDGKTTVLVEKILSDIEKNFILVSRNTHHGHGLKFQVPNTKHYFGMGMSLTYVNRNLVDSYHIKLNQDSNDFEYDGTPYSLIRSDILLYKYIPYVVKTSINDFVYELKHLFKKNKSPFNK